MAEKKKVKGWTGELGPGWDGGARTGPAWGKVSEMVKRFQRMEKVGMARVR